MSQHSTPYAVPAVGMRKVMFCPINRALSGVTEPETWETSGCAWRDEALRRMEREE